MDTNGNAVSFDAYMTERCHIKRSSVSSLKLFYLDLTALLKHGDHLHLIHHILACDISFSGWMDGGPENSLLQIVVFRSLSIHINSMFDKFFFAISGLEN